MQILDGIENIHLIEYLEYLSFIHLMNNSYLILTDSGGIQEDKFIARKTCLSDERKY